MEMHSSNSTNTHTEERRLWIGNLDVRITEYQLLKLVQKYGTIEKFDFLFHRNGPLVGQPRGYAFVTYMNNADAVAAKSILNNVLVGKKNIVVTWAHSVPTEEIEKPKMEVAIPALSMSKNDDKTDKESQIRAIEAKLRAMNEKSDELKINDTVATKPSVLPHCVNGNKTLATPPDNTFKTRPALKKNDRRPYARHKTHM